MYPLLADVLLRNVQVAVDSYNVVLVIQVILVYIDSSYSIWRAQSWQNTHKGKTDEEDPQCAGSHSDDILEAVGQHH